MPVNRGGAVNVVGLDELRKNLKTLDNAGELQAALKDANFKTADFVVQRAIPRMRSLGNVPGRRSAESMKATRSGAAARLSLAGKNAPFANGVEFGSGKFKQFKPWLGNGPSAGYAIYPTIRENTAELIRIYSEEIAVITRQAFPD